MHPQHTPHPQNPQYPQYYPHPPQWPVQVPPPQPKRRWGRWVALGAAVLVLCCAGSVAAIVVVPSLGKKDLFTSAKAQPTKSPSIAPAKSPSAGDPQSVFQAWAHEKVREALAKQRTALLAGNESGFLAVIDPKIPGTEKNALLRTFRSLRAMKVADWRDSPGTAVDKSNGLWAFEIFSTACFVSAECEDGPASADTIWRVEGATATLTSWKASDEAHPWQYSELVASSGGRTVVATTKNYESRLPQLVAEAEKAAIVADRFAPAGKTPSRYVIYFAGQTEWKNWFGWDPPEWSGGVAIDVSDDRYELVLNGQLHRSAVDDLLRHELTHASSLVGKIGGSNALWWLIEGIAEYAEMQGAPASTHPGISEVKKLVDSGDVTKIDISGPGRKTAEDVVAGQYGIAFLATRCLAERFTEEKMVEFFHTVVHDQKTLVTASTQVFQSDWGSVSADCFNYVKQAAG
ncbi:hypothetical protein [Catelliglobosispora koreensis]|uniref:hypothetical protein n=1 Tax=Catelliglobosispora koreensis TaxID=129052 RepID=UPI0012FC0F99|nr:hypothetical protein [Catelliglobosispora koreensis]